MPACWQAGGIRPENGSSQFSEQGRRMKTRRVRVTVEGRVQGVFFRACTKAEAARLGLAGWVRNRADGSVEAEIEGEAAAVKKMVQWFHQGSPGAAVTAVHLAEELPAGDSNPFAIRY